MKLFIVLALIAVAAAEGGPKVTDKVRRIEKIECYSKPIRISLDTLNDLIPPLS